MPITYMQMFKSIPDHNTCFNSEHLTENIMTQLIYSKAVIPKFRNIIKVISAMNIVGIVTEKSKKGDCGDFSNYDSCVYYFSCCEFLY